MTDTIAKTVLVPKAVTLYCLAYGGQWILIGICTVRTLTALPG